MNYFETLIDKITIGSDQFYDMFFNIEIETIIKNEYLQDYKFVGGQFLQDVANDLYDDPKLWWLICLTNKFTDPFFDIINSSSYIKREAVEYATINPYFWDGDDEDLFWTSSDFDNFWWIQADYLVEYERLDTEREEKRVIKVLKPEFVSIVTSQIINKIRSL